MKSSLQLNLKSQLTVTPHLQQAIRLLQLSTHDLQQEIQNQLENNPMLESTLDSTDEALPTEASLLQEDEFVDFQWTPLYKTFESNRDFNENSVLFDTLHRTKTNLQDDLRWQLNLSPITKKDRWIAEAIIDAINEDGFLTVSLTDLHDDLRQSYALDLEDMEVVLHRIQHLDPIGCGARTLSEALLIQLEQLPKQTPHLKAAKAIIQHDLKALAQHHYQYLRKQYDLDEPAMVKILAIIQTLNPRPGSVLSNTPTDYVTPDLIVQKNHQDFEVRHNPHILPGLSINAYYASLITRGNNTQDNQFLKHNLQEARWFLKNIAHRQETLLKVAQYLVNYQSAFLEHGEEAMKPLTLHDVARALGIHQSTVSRVTTQKYILTPQGVFELKYFFSNSLQTTQGAQCSALAVRALIKKLIANENPKKPLSDNKLANQILASSSIRVARRTVAKYRDELGIAPSQERKTTCS